MQPRKKPLQERQQQANEPVAPPKRSNKEIHPGGLLVVDKPAGLSSHDVVGRTRFLVQTRRVGHAGTLDPFATGVLLVCVGRATRLVPWLMGLQKTYEARLRFGWRSTTDDPEGELTQVDAPLPTREAIEAILPLFTGHVQQRPPAHSAIRVDGQRAYKKARRGTEVIMPERTVHVEALDLLHVGERSGGLSEVFLRVVCGSGTYIRALARDMGEMLGCGAYLTELRRTQVGPYTVDDAYPVLKDKTLNKAEEALAHLAPVGTTDIGIPSLLLDAIEAKRFLQGQRIAGREEPEVEEIAVRDEEGMLLGVAAIREEVLHPLVVLG